MHSDVNRALFDYISHSPTAFHTVSHSVSLLRQSGFEELHENGVWSLMPGKGYFVTRNRSSLIAFRVPESGFTGFMIAAAHGDSPTFKIRNNAEVCDGKYVRLSVEKYGGMLCSSWMDRPLSAAGRLLLRSPSGVRTELVDFREVCCLIPNVAIHMNRAANDGQAYNAAVDMLPLLGTDTQKGSFRARAAALCGASEEDVLSADLFVYNPQGGVQWGDMISAPRLDDLQCAFSALTALLNAKGGRALPVCCIFDNEEVGSETKQGAASTFLADTLHRVSLALGLDEEEYLRRVSCSFLASCDNAHAVHPNHPEYADKNNAPVPNGGIVIKYNAAQKYTTDAVSAAIFRTVCEKAGVKTQEYANRADLPGGSTLGNISNTQVSLNAVDIGLAQLAMHSAMETAGAQDTESMIRALTVLFESSLVTEADGNYAIE